MNAEQKCSAFRFLPITSRGRPTAPYLGRRFDGIDEPCAQGFFDARDRDGDSQSSRGTNARVRYLSRFDGSRRDLDRRVECNADFFMQHPNGLDRHQPLIGYEASPALFAAGYPRQLEMTEEIVNPARRFPNRKCSNTSRIGTLHS